MNSSFSWVSLLVIAVIVALLVQGFRMSPAGWIGLILKVVLSLLIALILGAVAWNTVVLLSKPK